MAGRAATAEFGCRVRLLRQRSQVRILSGAHGRVCRLRAAIHAGRGRSRPTGAVLIPNGKAAPGRVRRAGPTKRAGRVL